ncbi:MAG TPA: alkaline phosphatase family protein [Streptosporangiaceae bacterium]
MASPIKHVVVLYLENHSFDSLLGYWCNQNPGRCPDGGMPSSVTLSNGAVVTPDTMPDIVPNVDHAVMSQRKAINGGKMNGWWKISGCMPSTGYACIGGYQPSQVPNLTTLASDFAISDRTFSMADSPSWGGHLYAVMASTDGFLGDNPTKVKGVSPGPGWGCDSNKVSPWQPPTGAVVQAPSCIPDFSLSLPNGGAFEPTPVSYAPTIMDRLQNAGLSWRIFGEPTPMSGGTVSEGYNWDICPSFAECLDTSQANDNLSSSQFVRVAQRGKLPSFAVVTPGGADAAFSEHNGFSMTAGDDWLGQIATAVMDGPEWNSTALFITWDDCGCFYDQDPPGVNADGSPQGPRSPLLIVSPFARAGFTDTTATTFAGILGFVEHNFGLQALGPNDAAAYPFSNAFNLSQAPLKPVRMTYRTWPRDAYHIDMAEAREDT